MEICKFFLVARIFQSKRDKPFVASRHNFNALVYLETSVFAFNLDWNRPIACDHRVRGRQMSDLGSNLY